MNVRIKRIFFIFNIIFAVLLLITTVSAEESDDKRFYSIEYSAGIKGYYSSGAAEENIYYKPFAGIKFDIGALTIFPKFSRLLDYQITDGNGNYNAVSINKFGASLEYTLYETYGIEGEYSYYTGDSDYTANEYSAGLSYDSDDFGLSVSYMKTATSFKFGAASIDDVTNRYSVEYNYYTGANSSIDLSYDYKTQDFEGTGYIYSLSALRAGITAGISAASFFMTGLNLGYDSAEYIIAGADAGLIIKFYDHIKISLMYLGSYNIPKPTTADKTKKPGGGGSLPPNLKPSLAGESFFSQTASAGVTMVY